MIAIGAVAAAVGGMLVGWLVGRRQGPAAALARLAAVERERDEAQAIAQKREVTWKWPEGPVTRWEVVPELVERSYDMTLDANLAALAKDLALLPQDQHVELDVGVQVVGEWKSALMEFKWQFEEASALRWSHFGPVKRAFRGPPAEVQKELLEWYRDTTWGFYYKLPSGKYAWRRPGSPIRLDVSVKRRVIEAPPPRPEVRFVEVPVLASAPALPASEATLEDQERLAALVEVEVAAALARRRVALAPPAEESVRPPARAAERS